MNKKFMYSFAFLFAFALVSAGLVGYLSNEIEASVTVDLPVLLEISADGTNWEVASDDGITRLTLDNDDDVETPFYPLYEATFYIRDTNLADVFMPGQSLKTVTNTAGVTCDDFESVTVAGVYNLLADCVQGDDDFTVDFSGYTSAGAGLEANGEDGDSATNEIRMSFKPGAIGNYIFTMRKMTISSFE